MDDLIVKPATNLTNEDIAQINHLIAELVGEQGSVVDKEILQQIIKSESHVLLLARLSGEIVGMATLALLIGPAAGRKIYLDDFVTNPTIQGKGVGSKLWEAILDWGRQHGATKLEFTSRPTRQVAQKFT